MLTITATPLATGEVRPWYPTICLWTDAQGRDQVAALLLAFKLVAERADVHLKALEQASGQAITLVDQCE